jgi:hypothetical protein
MAKEDCVSDGLPSCASSFPKRPVIFSLSDGKVDPNQTECG